MTNMPKSAEAAAELVHGLRRQFKPAERAVPAMLARQAAFGNEQDILAYFTRVRTH